MTDSRAVKGKDRPQEWEMGTALNVGMAHFPAAPSLRLSAPDYLAMVPDGRVMVQRAGRVQSLFIGADGKRSGALS